MTMAGINLKPQILTELLTRNIGNTKYVQLVEDFAFISAILRRKVVVPKGFIYDFESVPAFRGTNKRGGTAHDYLCRIDSDPVVTKEIAAAVYFEIMECAYNMDDPSKRSRWDRILDWTRKWVKYGFVYIAPGYFHKYKVMDDVSVMKG